MLFSIDWLRQLCPVEAGAPEVADALTARGLTVDATAPAGADVVLDVDIPANRPDCLGHLGLARELSAATGRPLAEPAPPPTAAGDPVEAGVRVELPDPELCPRYTARIVRDVTVGPSPDWVVGRLEACGLRSINNVVDASNLVLLELGQPIHFFDLDRLRPTPDGPQHLIRVRRAVAKERMTTLDGVERILDSDTLIIADHERPLAIGGIIGGAQTEISDATRDVLIEAASFEPRALRATTRRLGLDTDASYRFGRGVDPEAPLSAQELACRLLVELAGGSAAPGLVDVFPGRREPSSLSVRPAEIERLLGYRPDSATIRQALGALQFEPTADAETTRVRVPSWRVDIEREADLVEEVARHVGYDRIPTAEVCRVESVTASPATDLEERSRDILSGLGFLEAVGYAMIAAGEDDPFVPADSPPMMELGNPIAEPLSHLRRSILPGLLRSVDLNQRRGLRDVRLFEVGRVFLASDSGFPAEPVRLGIAWSGAARVPHFSEPTRTVDAFDMFGLVERVVSGLLPGASIQRCSGAAEAFHPGRAACWRVGDVEVAQAGELHPDLGRELDTPAWLAEIDLSALADHPTPLARHSPLPRFPAVQRDLALVLSASTDYASVLGAVQAVNAPAPVVFDPIDRYQGPPLKPDETSLTLRFRLQPSDRTLTDAETEAYRLTLIETLREKLGVEIRG